MKTVSFFITKKKGCETSSRSLSIYMFGIQYWLWCFIENLVATLTIVLYHSARARMLFRILDDC